MGPLADCWQFVSSPPPWLKAWLDRQFLTHLKAYDERVEKLKEDIDSLKKLRYAVQYQVKEEVQRYNRGVLNLEEVEEWIKEVNETIIKYEAFIQDKDHEFAAFDVLTSGYLPKARVRLHLSKETFNFIGKVNELLNTTKHDTFSYWLGPPSMADLFENRSYESFRSRDAIVKNIKEALENPKVRIIGLHGSSGVGKTTLVKEIIREALQASEAGKLFDVVALANVTKNPDITKIQGQIAETLGMKLDEETDVVRAARIRERLKNEKESNLIILDDLWEELDLKMLGIPLEGGDGDSRRSRSNTMKGIPFENVKEVKNPTNAKHTRAKNSKKEETQSYFKGCKVLLVSERREVLINQMGGKNNSIYPVNVLDKMETKDFFNKMAGIGVRSSEFEILASQIASKCDGLPVSIVKTARALKGQSLSVWKDTLLKLERGKLIGANDFSTGLSYELLENEELKDAFLLSACMGPDALIMDLVKYCIGLGFLQGVYTAKEAWDRVYALVGKLKVSGLLFDSYSSDHFTMSDTVRSAALSIASKEKHMFTMTKGKVDEWPDEDKLESYTAISLHHCDIIDGFPSSINCPKLRVFHFNSNDPQLVIPINLFEGMKELRVLILTGINLSPCPSSIRCLTKLRMLCLEQCKLDKDLSFIGELKNLRILSFSGSDVEKLPVELKDLTKLQIFDISNCFNLKEIPSTVISSLVRLEELYMRNTSIQWEVNVHGCQSKNASLSELTHLNQLASLDMQIPNDSYFPKKLFFDQLHSYKIVIGDLNAHSDMDFKIPEKYEASKFLAIQSKDGFDIHSQKGIKMLFERVEHLILEDLIGVKDFFYGLNLKGFPYLKHLLIVNNSNIESLINPKERGHPERAFPRLESLHLHNLKNLDKICFCKLSEPSFRKLKVIKINICGKLRYVFSTSVVKLLTVLETVEVSDCYVLKEIVEVEAQRNGKTEDIVFPELRSLTLQSLNDSFIGFYLTPSSRDLFNGKVIVSKLERMVLSSIHIHKIWSGQGAISCFENLIHLDVNGCRNLEYLISLSMAKSLVNLQTLFVSECENMTNIFSQKQGSQAEIEGSIFPKLKNIKLRSMNRLIEIWNSKLPSNSFDKLETLTIEECARFVNVFPCHMEGIFRSLCHLRVANCKSMKTVFELDHNKCKNEDLKKLRDVYLETLPKLDHVWKWSNAKDGILELKNLQKMWIHDCSSLENVFTVSVARNLPSLEHLVILHCFGLREIVAMRDDSKTGTSSSFPSFEFPKLTTIKFSELIELSCFYPDVHELSCPTLNDLSIEFCYRLEPFKKGHRDAPKETSPTDAQEGTSLTDVQAQTSRTDVQAQISPSDVQAQTSSSDIQAQTSPPDVQAQKRLTFISEEGINKLNCMQIEWWYTMSSSNYMWKSYRWDNLKELCLTGFMNPEDVYSFLHGNPYLKSLSLECCSLTHIVPLKMPPEFENLGVVPKLKTLKLIDLPDLETIGFEQDIILERIEFLILKNCPRLVNMIPSYVSLTHLTNLEVFNCGGLEKLMPPSVAKHMVQLNSMKVMKCESIVEIVDDEVDAENTEKMSIVFRQLKVLELVSLKNFNCFSKSYTVFEFPTLEKLVVSACPKMEFFSKNVINTPLLQKISIGYEKEKKISLWKDDIDASIRQIFKEKEFFEVMDEMSLSEHHDLQQNWHCLDGYLERSWFFSLKTLKLEGCENLSCAIPKKILPHLKSLKELEVRNCNRVKVIFEKNDTEVTPSQLKNLTLEGLSELVCVWENNCQGNLIFHNLQQVFVSNCKRLQTLFPEALAKKLEKLEKLEIESCNKLHEIVGQENNVAIKFVFPCLTWLDLYCLPELTFFYPGTFSVECHDLHKLFVLLCPKLELFKIACHEGEASGSSISNDRQALFPDLMAIHNLEELSVDSKHTLEFKSRVQQFKEKLKFLVNIRLLFDVDDNEAHTLAHDIHQKAPNLQDMWIEQCNNLEKFSVSDQGGNQLKILTLTKVFKLQSISSGNSWLNTVCKKKLRELIIIECPDLTKIFHIATTESFSNLTILYISECHELEYLFPASVAKLLENLEQITVMDSQNIKEIVAKETDGGATSPEFIFKRLYWLTLNSLSSLECFYSGNDTLQLPSLKQVDMWQCPKMEVFSRGEVNVKYFRGIQVSPDTYDEPVFHKDLNILVKRVVLLQMLPEGINEAMFSKHEELQKAWHDDLSQNNWFYCLRKLILENCDFEQYAIPSNVLCCLKNLRELEVRNCKRVKVIFEMKDSETKETCQLNYLTLEGLSELTHVWEMNCQGILMFQNLRQVVVSGCKSMKALLHVTLAKKLKMLERLDIEYCQELQEIVGKEDDATTDPTKEFVFRRLTSLSLQHLPKLTSFYPGSFTVVCPKLNYLNVVYCSKMELFQSVHYEGEGDSSNISINRQPLFLDFKAIYILEELVLNQKHISVFKLGQCKEDLKRLCKILLCFDVEENENPALPPEIFEMPPNLQEMTIECCQSLDVFDAPNQKSSEHELLENLKTLNLYKVSKLKFIGLGDSLWLNTVHEKLQQLNVYECPDLKTLFPSTSVVSFSNLKELSIVECADLEYLFTPSSTKNLIHLEKITVNECGSMRTLLEKDEDEAHQGVEFKHLSWIYLISLSSLDCFYSGSDTLQLPSLTEVQISQCPKMKVFSQGETYAKSFRGIQASSDTNDELVFHNDLSSSVKKVFLQQMLSEGGVDKKMFSDHSELRDAWDGKLSPQDKWFYSLRTLKLDNCDFDHYAIPYNVRCYLKNLIELVVRNCEKVKVIFEMNDSETKETSQLIYLTLEGLSELTHVWGTNCQGILKFKNLQQVDVSDCKKMKALLPATLAKELRMLETLNIKSCHELQEVVGREDDATTDPTNEFVFPRLTSLSLQHLPKLTSFYPGSFTVGCPKLNYLNVMYCSKMKLFQGVHCEGEGDSSGISINRQPLFLDFKAISFLEELSLNQKHISVLRLGQCKEDLKRLCKILLCFDVEENENPTLPLEIFEMPPNLEEMTIECFQSLDVFLPPNPKFSEPELLKLLKTLTLSKLSKLKFIGLSDSSWLNIVCKKLQQLIVRECPDLTTLFPSIPAASFSKLKEVSIIECVGLEYLFTLSTAKNLINLEKITIENCSSMRTILEKDEDEAHEGVEFRWLCGIYLISLSSLDCFYSGNDTLQLPSLTEVEIRQCVKMEVFSRGEINAKSFRGIQASSNSNDKLVFHNDLNSSVKKVFLQQEHLVFKDSFLLKAIWLKAEMVPDLGFRNLNTLIIEGCDFLSDVILPSHLIPFLSNLKILEVRKCNSVTAIFVYTKIGPEGSLSLPNLEKLCVESCDKMVEIIAKDKTDTEEADKDIVKFPKVTFLKLWNLCSLRCIYPGVHILQWPVLKELHVMHCPMLKFFATELHSSPDSYSECQDSLLTNQQAFISLEQVTPCLEVLSLGKEEAKMIEQGILHVDLQELNSLILQCFHDESYSFPFVFCSKPPLPTIKKLVVRHSAFKEIFPLETSDIDYTKFMSQLVTLELRSLSLVLIGIEHPWMDPFLKNLRTLLVRDCGGLKNLTPSTVSFSNLIKLNVKNCSGLKYLFTSETAKTLRLLTKLFISNCKSLKAIVAKEGDEFQSEYGDQDENENKHEEESKSEDGGGGASEMESEDESEAEDKDEDESEDIDESEDGIIFKKLEILSLSSLPKLGTFYSGTSTLKFPALKSVSFTKCYNMKIFRFVDELPEDLKITKDEKCQEGDINSIMQQFEGEIHPGETPDWIQRLFQ